MANGAAWGAVVPSGDRLALAVVKREAAHKPVVSYCEVYAHSGEPLETLKRVRTLKGFACKRCVTVLGEGQYQMMLIDKPDEMAGLPADELRQALRWRIKDRLEFPVEAAGIDFIEVPAIGSRPAQLWVVVSPHAVLRPCIEHFQSARLPLAAIDIPELAERNLVSLFEETNRALAALSFGARGARLLITYRGDLYLARSIEVASDALIAPGNDLLHERVLLDIQRSLDNFDRLYSAISLSRLVVGPLPGGDAFIDYLSANLPLPVMRADLAEVLALEAVPHLAAAEQQRAAWLALGAALRG